MAALILALVAGAAGCSLFHSKKASAAAPAGPSRIIKLDSTVLNLADANPAYLRIGVSVAVTSIDQGLDANTDSVTRDTVVSLASSQTSDVLLTPAGKVSLKNAILAELRKRLPQIGVQKVYFDEFLVQH